MQYLIFFVVFMTYIHGVQSPEAALERLKNGNKRFVDENLLHPDRTEDRRNTLIGGQSPFAVIITCSDSRVVPEMIFDEGIGDLFVIRIAGNVVGTSELESVEFAVSALSPQIILVMGHENCGAVNAVVTQKTKDIPYIAKLIQPSVTKAKSIASQNTLENSIKLNALQMRELLLNSKTINKAVNSKSIAIYSAYYNLKTGLVDILTN